MTTDSEHRPARARAGLAVLRSALDARLLVPLGLLLVLSYATTVLGRSTVDTLIQEEGLIEGLGAAAFFAAGVFAFLAFLRDRRRAESRRWRQAVLLGLAVLFVFAAGEEVSWGQRILGLETPEALESFNDQGETNVHNLEPLGGLLSFDRLFPLFWLAFAVALPVAAAVSDRARRFLEPRVPLVPLAVAALFLVNQALAMATYAVLPASLYDSEYPFAHTVTEIKETDFAILFAVGMLVVAGGLRGASRAAVHDRATAPLPRRRLAPEEGASGRM